MCQWLAELGLGEYEETVMSREVTGRQLIQLQKEDFLVCRVAVWKGRRDTDFVVLYTLLKRGRDCVIIGTSQ